MSVSGDVNFEELARSTDEFNGAQLKAVCVEAGMIALREGATKLGHEHFLSGISEGDYIHPPPLMTLAEPVFQFKARRRTTLCTLHDLVQFCCIILSNTPREVQLWTLSLGSRCLISSKSCAVGVWSELTF